MMKRTNAVVFAFALALGFVAKVGAQSLSLPLPAANKVIAHDDRGRAKATEMVTPTGSCLTQVIYDLGPAPEIHIAAFSKNGPNGNIGRWILLEDTEQTLTAEKLMAYFNQIIRVKCLPIIMPGWKSTWFQHAVLSSRSHPPPCFGTGAFL